MKSKLLFSVFVAVVVALFVGPACRVKIKKSEPTPLVAFTPEEQTAAIKTVHAFLRELDAEAGNPRTHFSLILKKSIPEFAWSAALAAFHASSGKNISRGNAAVGCTEQLEGAPPGRYFIFDIESRFEKAELVERIVLVLEENEWKIAGYFRTKRLSLEGTPKSP